MRPDALPAPVCLRVPVPVVPAASRLLPVPLERLTVLILSPLLYSIDLHSVILDSSCYAGFQDFNYRHTFLKKKWHFFPILSYFPKRVTITITEGFPNHFKKRFKTFQIYYTEEKDMNYVDLHVHSNASDGTLSPGEVVRMQHRSS